MIIDVHELLMHMSHWCTLIIYGQAYYFIMYDIGYDYQSFFHYLLLQICFTIPTLYDIQFTLRVSKLLERLNEV